MQKIRMTTPLVEIDGDEMTRIIWQMIKDQLILPFVDLKSEYYDLSLTERDRTDDQITVDAALACKRYGVGVKCATITANAQRQEEYNLKHLHPSPNATLRGLLDGTIFRTPIMVNNISPVVKPWKKPITIARHAYGDVYKNTELRTTESGTAILTFVGDSGDVKSKLVQKLPGKAVIQGMHNLEESIDKYAHSCFRFALASKQDLWFSTKDTISKTYDGTFKEIFQNIFEKEYQAAFAEAGIEYFYTLIDDAVARVIRSEGGYIWACKNYDGDVMSDMVSAAFGSLAMMSSVLMAPDGTCEYEAAHGTVTKHYYRYRDGEKTSTNPMATIFAWGGALEKRGELDKLPELERFGKLLCEASIATIEDGIMTGDLIGVAEGDNLQKVNTEEFLAAVRERLEARL
ncbi:MAG TPA: NADP-dependent isocitrate dehydrogenase [Clostridiaceae bacterium]|nr:NADP-dependent isocitrate dehydrogenase [Clostridiaceae bacterium]